MSTDVPWFCGLLQVSVKKIRSPSVKRHALQYGSLLIDCLKRDKICERCLHTCVHLKLSHESSWGGTKIYINKLRIQPCCNISIWTADLAHSLKFQFRLVIKSLKVWICRKRQGPRKSSVVLSLHQQSWQWWQCLMCWVSTQSGWHP